MGQKHLETRFGRARTARTGCALVRKSQRLKSRKGQALAPLLALDSGALRGSTNSTDGSSGSKKPFVILAQNGLRPVRVLANMHCELTYGLDDGAHNLNVDIGPTQATPNAFVKACFLEYPPVHKFKTCSSKSTLPEAAYSTFQQCNPLWDAHGPLDARHVPRNNRRVLH